MWHFEPLNLKHLPGLQRQGEETSGSFKIIYFFRHLEHQKKNLFKMNFIKKHVDSSQIMLFKWDCDNVSTVDSSSVTMNFRNTKEIHKEQLAECRCGVTFFFCCCCCCLVGITAETPDRAAMFCPLYQWGKSPDGRSSSPTSRLFSAPRRESP